jgi:hypothetical protein
VWAVAASIVQTGTATQLISGRHGLQRLVPTAAIAVAGPPVWVAILGDRPIALSIAAVVNATVGAAVVMTPVLRHPAATSTAPEATSTAPEATSTAPEATSTAPEATR